MALGMGQGDPELEAAAMLPGPCRNSDKGDDVPVEHSFGGVGHGSNGAATPRVAAVVLGMHRSGTSALTRALSLAGFVLPRRLLSGTEDNAEGFWESPAVVTVNNRVLAALGQDWTSIGAVPPHRFHEGGMEALRAEAGGILREDYGDAPRFVVKDPRMARLIPFWDPVFRAVGARPCFVHPVRNPLDVTRSLARRNGFGQTRSLLMWIDHTLAVLRAAEDAPVAFVDFEDLLARPAASVEGVLRRLGLDAAMSDEARDALDAAVKPGLRHHRVPPAALDLDARTAAMAYTLHGLVGRAAICHGPAPIPPPEMLEAWTRILELQAAPGLAGFVAELDTAWRPPASPSDDAYMASLAKAATLLAGAQAVLSRLLPASDPAVPDAGQPSDGSQDPTYEGQLDCLVGTVLYGWCWKQSSGDRVPLRLDLDQRDSGRAVASQFRADLYASAIGDGWHAFAIDLNGQADMRDETVVRVLTEDSAFILPGSGRTVAELRQVG